MAMSSGAKSGVESTPNVTPMVDVMLVLLIVFMIAAPLLTVGVPVDLPRADAPQINERSEPVVVTVDARGQIYIQNTVAKPNELVPRLRAMRASNPARAGGAEEELARGMAGIWN